ncbi:MAG: Bifunctional NAD(P)H-hydrate repair enzyme Nnr [Smithella sp. PtaU1.Bin162]|nr:MAG: Bifunctional NAD(P)H-hydrate repair enzyme Nnr [Smithella sp. PtaU1.Bin162]
MAGAAILSGLAAFRAGTGLLTIAAPESSILAFQSAVPEALTISLGSVNANDSVKQISSYIQNRKVKSVLIGNGLGTGNTQKAILEYVLESKEIERLVLDADALNILSEDKKLRLKLKNCGKDMILTPHIGEASRILNLEPSEIKQEKINVAKELEKTTGGIVVLKDAVSIISTPDNEIWVNTTGSPVLAKGGSGDVLAGLIAGLFTSGYDALSSAIIGCYLLGKAAEIYEQRFSSESAFAREIISILPEAWKFDV